MKRVSDMKQKLVALWLFAAMLSCAGLLSAQSQGTGNKIFTVNHIPIKMVFVKGGEMQLGCTASRDDSCMTGETPLHTVKLSDFYIGETEVTQAQWMAVMGRDNNPSYWKGNTLPVERVSWAECQRFIARLNKYLAAELPEGYRFALPSEAQWEYAARGGMKSAGTRYAGGNDLNQLAWYYSNSNERTHDVRIKAANELGVFDMSGNVWEWCQDWYNENYYVENQDWDNPLNNQEADYFVQRGGSWNYAAPYQRCAKRDRGSQHSRYEDCGFRIALVPKR
ncbi:MAG: formylglycine-generating enzyme family protein [Bacteroidales bacterium]|nr:formylglycine-generating enzyme family protein [Bacteroidales bacterium]